MTRAFTFVVLTVTYVISYVIHLIATRLFHPDGPLYGVATDGTEIMNGPERAHFMFEVLSVYVPLLAVAGITAWAVVKEYRRQTQTTQRRVR